MPNVFRWNIARREQLGRLVAGDKPADCFPAVLDEVPRCSARVIAAAGDARLVFVGRSPENLFDYLTGALAGTSWSDRLAILHLSLKNHYETWAEMSEQTRCAMREQFAALGLDPMRIATTPRPVALIDVIYEGETFGKLVGLLAGWAADERIDDRAVRRRMRIVAIVTRGEDGYTTQRWKRLDWALAFRPGAVKGVPVPQWFWSYLGDSDAKVTRPNPPRVWGDPEMARPPRGPRHAEALRLALDLYEAGRSRIERDALAAAIAKQPAVRHVWCRVLASEFRAVSRPKRVERLFSSKQRVRSWRRHVRRRTRFACR